MSETINLWNAVKIYGNNIGVVDRSHYICQNSINKKILHIGCADYPITKERYEKGTLLHLKLEKVAAYCKGIDASEEGIKILKTYGCTNVEVLDAEKIDDLKMKYDVIIASDVLEHMTNPSGLLKNVPELLEKKGELIVAVPNAYSWNIFRYLLKGVEPTHYDHCFYFSVKTLTELCRRFNLKPVELAFTVQPPGNGHKLFFIGRKFLINLFPKMSPAIILKFQRSGDLNSKKDVYTWK